MGCLILLPSMHWSKIEFSMTLKFVIEDGFEKNFQKFLLCQVKFCGYFGLNL